MLEAEFIPINLKKQYEKVSNILISRVEEKFSKHEFKNIRIHADCHLGNILWREQRPHFVDFDDSRNGPAVQDLWMFLSGNLSEKSRQMTDIIRGYTDFRDFNFGEVTLIESLRALRIMRHSAWIGRRWADPAFPKAFPFFNTEKYWVEHLHQLSEQIETIEGARYQSKYLNYLYSKLDSHKFEEIAFDIPQDIFEVFHLGNGYLFCLCQLSAGSLAAYRVLRSVWKAPNNLSDKAQGLIRSDGLSLGRYETDHQRSDREDFLSRI